MIVKVTWQWNKLANENSLYVKVPCDWTYKLNLKVEVYVKLEVSLSVSISISWSVSWT